jgi:DNA-binding response OmpR family regulator
MKDSFQILVIEDQPRHQKIFAETLQHELEVTVQFALDGEDGLQKIASENKPDLVVLDLDLPTISGKDVLKRLKANMDTRLIPVMVLTGSSSQLAELDLLESGAEDYLEKGSHPDILISRIRAQIRHKKAIDRLQNLAINRDIFAAGILANISSARKTLNDQAEVIRQVVLKNPTAEIPAIHSIMDSMCEQASKLGQFANDVIQSVRDAQHSSHPRKVDLDLMVEKFEPVQVDGRADVRTLVKGKLGTVTIDPNYFRILLSNLAQNSAKRSDQVAGTLSSSIYAEQHLDRVLQGVAVRKFVIRDFSGKIDIGTLSTLFEPIVIDADGERELSFDINLAVAKNVIQKMAGEIWAEAPKDNGLGIEFHFFLPK